GHAVASQLRASGREVWIVTAGDGYEQISSNELRVDARDRNQIERAWERIDRAAGARGIQAVCLWPLDAPEADSGDGLLSATTETCGRLLHVVQVVARSRAADLVLVTRGAQAVTAAQRVSLAQAGVLGFLRTVARELPDIRCRAIDLDVTGGEHESLMLADELRRASHGEVVVFREGIRRVARLAPVSLSAARELVIRPDASYLITGGLGSLGLRVAEWLVERGARNLWLSSRREPSDATQSTIGSLEARGARVRVVCADVARSRDVE